MVEPWSAVPEWIAKAEGDREALDILLNRNTPGLRDGVVFHAQQCVEKLLKARLIQLGQPVDKIHDLAALSRQLEAVVLRSSDSVLNLHRGWRESFGPAVP